MLQIIYRTTSLLPLGRSSL